MGYLTKYGTLWANVPETTGRVFWVAPSTTYTVDGRAYTASDGNDGLSPERALATINQAITNATSDVGDVVMLLGAATGTNHTDSIVVTLNKSGITFVGITPHLRQNQVYRNNAITTKVTWTSTLAGTAVANTGADNAFIGINFVPVTARTFMTLVGASRNAFIDCAVTLSAAASTSTKGLVASGTNTDLTFTNCKFLNTVATSAQGPALDLTGAARFFMDDCDIILTGTSSAWAKAVQFGAGTSGTVRRTYAGTLGAGAMTVGFDGTGIAVAGAVTFVDCRAGVSPGAGFCTGSTATDVNLVNNYLATVSGGTGSTLITTTT